MSSPLIKNIPLFLDDKPSVYALRQQAKQIVEEFGFPSKKTEAWKYTDVRNLIQSDFSINTEKLECECCSCNHDTKKKDSLTTIEIHFCKGKIHIEEYNTPKGLIITPLPLALYEGEYKKHLFKTFNMEKHPFAALNGMYLEQGVCIYLEPNTKIKTPIILKYNQDNCENLQIHIHNLIILEKNSELDLIEDIESNDKFIHFTNIVNEIYLKTEAHLNHYKVQKESPYAYHMTLNAIKTLADSHYKQFYFSNGAKLSRQETLIDLQQQGANAEIYSAYKAKTDCLTDITTDINHLVQNTYSNQYAKAVLEKDSNAVFQGKIHISPNAIKTSGQQLHKALYLDNNACLNCKPELEIYADDVKCSHGASCGEIDKEQLFYLTSRGIDKETATNMLISAHLDEIFSFITNKDVQDYFSSLKNIFS